MSFKSNNLDKIKSIGLNIFEYKLIDNIDDLINYSKLNNKFSIRFDSENKVLGLPFYTYDSSINNINDLIGIINEMKQLNSILLVSNGYKYDNDIKFNFVIEKDFNNNFIFELCSKKIPLRDMYKYTTTIINGNIFDTYKDFKFTNIDSNTFNKNDILKILDIMINNMSINYIEGTIYNTNHGILNDDIIVWEINLQY